MMTEATDKISPNSEIAENDPWQLKLFRKSLKKQQKLKALVEVLGRESNRQCLLITCGDNNGAMNWHLRKTGGDWSWADAERDSIAQISEVTGDAVAEMDKDNPILPFLENSFDVVITIDVHEHLVKPEVLNQELARLVKHGGKVIVTTPNGDEHKLVTRIKGWIGMHPEDYGHYVIGYDVPHLKQQLETVGLNPYSDSSYSKFLTEIMELAINYIYVKVLSKRSEAKVEKGQIAPQNIDQVKSIEKTLRLYSYIYPVLLLVSKLDFIDRSPRGYAVIVAAQKD
jgi:2-polyprenyl-3-methyl-5-hydroxy-6-metoxy-1,4-benzoquinol methylase